MLHNAQSPRSDGVCAHLDWTPGTVLAVPSTRPARVRKDVASRPGAVIPWGARTDRPDHDYLDGLRLRVFTGGSGTSEVTVTTPDGRSETFTVDLSEVTR